MKLSREAIGHMGSNCCSRGSMLVYIRKPVAKSGFPGERNRPGAPWLDPLMYWFQYFNFI